MKQVNSSLVAVFWPKPHGEGHLKVPGRREGPVSSSVGGSERVEWLKSGRVWGISDPFHAIPEPVTCGDVAAANNCYLLGDS
jgi:hypothetical protein